MRRYVTTICLVTILSIILLTMAVLSTSAKMTGYLSEKQESLVVARGIEGLDAAKNRINKDLKEKVAEASVEAFDIMTQSVYDEGVNITEADANELYKYAVLQVVRGKYGMYGVDNADAFINLNQSIIGQLPELKTGELFLNEGIQPHIAIDGNKIYLKNVAVDFTYDSGYKREIMFDVFDEFNDIVLYDENPELFTYSMIADKGIYITGKTSTIMGNVYAGTHAPSELRKAEALYGESSSYGGINIMSTQVAIDSDRIVSEGVINMKGAFAVFGTEDSPVTISAKGISETDNIASKNIYALFGDIADDDISKERAMCAEAMKYFGSIEHYYDSDNDHSYLGQYRKIISSTDVTVKSDVTGVIITPGSVIIEEGVNVEGIILSGDRIYIQGNNNIVSSVEVLRGLLKEELYTEAYSKEEYATDEERALNSIHLNMKDYVGGIKRRGIVEK